MTAPCCAQDMVQGIGLCGKLGGSECGGLGGDGSGGDGSGEGWGRWYSQHQWAHP